MRRRSVALALAALTLPILVACGNSGGSDAASSADDTSATATATATASPSDTATATPAKCVKTGATVPSASTKVGETPNITKPTGAPPCKLIVKDLKVGSGAPVTDTATSYDWNYEGVSWSNGQVFDSSFARGEPIAFSLNQVIPGWTEGLQGMKPGGRRLLVIPPEQGYGATGQGAIGPNETLVFVVDLVGPTAG